VSGVADNLAEVRRRIEATGRNPGEITIVAVTKGFGPDRCREAIAAGLTTLGENRVHEALTKIDEVAGAEWHLIGHLQTNKVRLVTEHFALIHSVDSIRLAELLARDNPRQQVLVEVNASREPQKSGVAPDDAITVIKEISDLLDLRGLMTIGPSHGDPAPAFLEMATLRDAAQQRLGRPLPVLSMGMSGDFEAALAAGSTMLRLGQILFGPRPA
jgi:pyridoxal phosphate enzyme (YggS family)